MRVARTGDRGRLRGRVAAAGACVPATAPGAAAPAAPTARAGTSTVIETTLGRADDRIDVQVVDGTATLDIASQTGIGAAAVQVLAGPYPTAFVFQLHLKGLEQFTLTYGAVKIDVAVANDGSDQARQTLIKDGVEQPLTPEPYWMPVTVTREAGVRIPGTVREDLPARRPARFFTVQPPAFSITWIDFFR
ncbi:MAG: hypothetical protein HZY76_04450 [Anaerolineae bacterium]|nr:MAG: hypothetical protein HZY76_04450 [Anaerolineae bacterium]